MSKRAFIIVLDSFGIGSSQDASAFDQGSNTLGSIARHCAQAKADNDVRKGYLKIPNLCRLGLNEALYQSSGAYGAGLTCHDDYLGAYGFAVEQSAGKDTPSGHWEMAGLPVLKDWGYFAGQGKGSFPQTLIDTFIEKAKLPGVLGLCHASGTEIIKRLGQEHIDSGKPIVYTSADSVFQIAAHEKYFGLDRLIEICHIARELVDDYRIGRVIARPFIGETIETFKRTPNRRDLATPPFDKTLLDYVKDNGNAVYAIGKISDIFSGHGITHKIKTIDNDDGFNKLTQTSQQASDGDLVFVNLNDFDSQFGHRRDVAGYATALENFDKQLPEFIAQMQSGDLAIIAADHGCDPSWPGSDHTREHIPVLAFGPEIKTGSIGRRDSFADIGQTIASHFGLPKLKHGISFQPGFGS
jgi:phosphopentomutase